VDVIDHQVPFFNAAFPVLGQLPEHPSKVRPQGRVQRLPPALWDKHDVVFALPYAVA
jgi:hypothetical protein